MNTLRISFIALAAPALSLTTWMFMPYGVMSALKRCALSPLATVTTLRPLSGTVPIMAASTKPALPASNWPACSMALTAAVLASTYI
ncbi:hypothetical protein D3C83_141250 [compost metagenome]